MKQSEIKNAPWLGGWVIAAAAGLVAGAVTYVVGDFTLTKAGFIGVLVMLAIGLFMAMPSRAGSLQDAAVKPASKPAPALVAKSVVSPAPTAAPVMAEAAPAVAAFMSAPVADAAPVKAPRAAIAKTAPAAKAAAKPVAKVAAKAAAKPAVAKAPKVKKPDGPMRLSAPRKGKADDLKEIEGIGPALEKLCNSLGFYHFDQIANWSDADVEWVDANMKTFKGRIVRDKWIAQSKIIITEGLDAFRIRAQTNNY